MIDLLRKKARAPQIQIESAMNEIGCGDLDRICDMLREGMSTREIAKAIPCSKVTVQRYRNDINEGAEDGGYDPLPERTGGRPSDGVNRFRDNTGQHKK